MVRPVGLELNPMGQIRENVSGTRFPRCRRVNPLRTNDERIFPLPKY